MKTIRTIVVTMMMANVLALAGFTGWLAWSGRLDRARVERVREIFRTTIAQEAAAKAEIAAKEEEDAKAEAAAIRLASIPMTAAEKIRLQVEQEESALQGALRREREIEGLRTGLIRQKQALDARERSLAAEKAEFDATRQRYAAIEGAEQFKTALATLEGQKPRDAKAMLGALLAAQQVEQVVAYLSRMDEGKRTKVLAEFVREEPAAAADLLERLRTRGTGETGAGTAPVAVGNALEAHADDPSAAGASGAGGVP